MGASSSSSLGHIRVVLRGVNSRVQDVASVANANLSHFIGVTRSVDGDLGWSGMGWGWVCDGCGRVVSGVGVVWCGVCERWM